MYYIASRCDVRFCSLAMVALFWKTSRDFHSRGQRSVTLIVLDKLQLIALVSPEEG